MVWSGHQHLQEHIQYDGAEYLIQGAASKVRNSRWDVHVPEAKSIFLSSQLGFGHLRLDPLAANIDYLDIDGEVIHTARVERTLRPSEADAQEQ